MKTIFAFFQPHSSRSRIHPAFSRCVPLLAALVLAVFASTAYSLAIISVTIAPDTVLIGCDSSKNIVVTIVYRLSSTDVIRLADSAAAETLSVWQHNGRLTRDNHVGDGTFKIPKGAQGGRNYTVRDTITLSCAAQDDGICVFSGNVGEGKAGSPHKIYAIFKDVRSTNEILVSCRKPNGALCYLTPLVNPANPVGTESVAISILSPQDPVGGVSLNIALPGNPFTYINFQPAPNFTETFSNLTFDTANGEFHFTAPLATSHVIADTLTIGSINFFVAGSAPAGTTTPYGVYEISLDTTSHLYADTGMVHIVDALLGAQMIAVLPDETTAPKIDTALITVTPSGITGAVNAITDTYSDTLADWVTVSLMEDDSLTIDADSVMANGSFTLNDTILSDSQLTLIAINGAGKSASWKFTPSFPTYVPEITAPLLSIAVYPNPFTKPATVLLQGIAQPEGARLVFEMYDVLGRNVYSQTIQAPVASISPDVLPGVYRYIVRVEEKVIGSGAVVRY